MEFWINLLLVFFVFSFIGWCIEVTLKYRQYGRFINRGFLIGPWLPIYGAGAAVITGSVNGIASVESGIGTTFVISFFSCGILEYLTSFCMEKRFHARWWDYSTKPMNLHGRVWIGNLLLFGLGGIGIIHLVNPILYAMFGSISLFTKEIIAVCFSIIFFTDYVISHFVLKLVKIGVETSKADNTEEISKDVRLLLRNKNIFYRRFADAYPDVIYRTEKVIARMERIRLETERMRAEASRKISEGRQQWHESKSSLNASLEAGKAQIKSSLEPTFLIKNKLIDKQNELIDMLYNENTASSIEKALMEEIIHERERLDNRI